MPCTKHTSITRIVQKTILSMEISTVSYKNHCEETKGAKIEAEVNATIMIKLIRRRMENT